MKHAPQTSAAQTPGVEISKGVTYTGSDMAQATLSEGADGRGPNVTSAHQDPPQGKQRTRRGIVAPDPTSAKRVRRLPLASRLAGAPPLTEPCPLQIL